MSKSPEQLDQLRRLGANVRRARLARGLTQEQLAERAELSLRNIQRIEAGQLDILVTTFLRVRRALRCPADQLLPR